MKCLVVQPVHPRGLEVLADAGIECVMPASERMADVVDVIADCDAVITRNAGLDSEAIAAGKKLRVIGSHGSGVNKVALPAATAAGIAVVNTPGSNARSVAELAIAMMLALLKRTVPLDQAVRQGDWAQRYQPGLRELSGMTLGIVGFGRIGQALARMAIHGFGMKVEVYSPSVPVAQVKLAGCTPVQCLLPLLGNADVVSLHRPGQADGTPVIDAAALAAMKPGALLINTARASLVDEAALLRHLRAGRLGGAGIDVFGNEPPPVDHPLLGLPQVVLAPHVGGSTEEALARTAVAVASQVVAVLNGEKPAYLVNPDVWERRRGSGGWLRSRMPPEPELH